MKMGSITSWLLTVFTRLWLEWAAEEVERPTATRMVGGSRPRRDARS